MKKLTLILAILLIGLSACKKSEPVQPTPTPPVVVEGFGCVEVHVSKMNIESIKLEKGYDVYYYDNIRMYMGTPGDYYVKFCDIKNIELNYTIKYRDNSTVSKGKITVVIDQTVILWGI